MGQDLFFHVPIEITVALLAFVPILLVVLRVMLALRKPATVRMPGHPGEAPYKLEAPGLLLPGQLHVVPQAGREPANR